MKIAKKFDGKGWFVFTVAAMAAEDEAAIAQVRAIFNNRTFYGSYETPEKMVERTCHTLENAKMARYSRRGWLTIEHPILGMLQWRSGVDFRTAQSYFILRLNGREVYRS